VRRSPRPGEVTRGAVLYVHGFTDYFFQTGLADFFAARGLRFYALDLRKCGRAHVHRGIETGVPVLVLRSDKSLTAGEYSPVCDRCDLVLNTKQIGPGRAASAARSRTRSSRTPGTTCSCRSPRHGSAPTLPWAPGSTGYQCR